MNLIYLVHILLQNMKIQGKGNSEGGTSSLRQQKRAFTKQWRNRLWS